MTKKFSQIWVNQTELGKKFGLSAVSVGKILIEHELKDSKTGQATQKAIEGGYAKSTPLKNGTPFFMWHLQKTKDLVSKKHVPLSEVDYWVNEVKKNLSEAERLLVEGQDKLSYLIMDHVYEEVPQKIRAAVKSKIELQNARNPKSNAEKSEIFEDIQVCEEI
jgi:hypothetical protein